MNLKHKQILIGLATYVPGIYRRRAKGTGGSDSALYCYSVWLRHLVMAGRSGLNTHPRTIAELGPGDSLGMGLAALLSGGDRYFAFDVVEHANVDTNLAVFEELVALFKDKHPIPGDDEFPKVKPRLDSYDFPDHILTEERLAAALEPGRIDRIRDSIRNPGTPDSLIQYKVPWNSTDTLEAASVDMILSQAVLEHVEDLEGTYASMADWLGPNGFLSHTIDFKCHGTADEWNGHWTYSKLLWRIMRGKRPYLINRQPYSAHAALLRAQGFEIVCHVKTAMETQYARADLAAPFSGMPEEDVTTSGAFVQAVRSR